MGIRILLADDHAIMRRELRLVLERQHDFEVVAEASSGSEAVSLAQEHHPDVAVLDIGMEGVNGIEATKLMMTESPRTAVLILTMHNDKRYVERSLAAGARGYLLKDFAEENLIQAVRRIYDGHTYFSPAAAQHIEKR